MKKETKGFLWGMLVWVIMALSFQYIFFKDVDNNVFIWIFMCGAITSDVVRSVRKAVVEPENENGI